MVRAGGEGGFLEDALERVATFTEQQEDLKGRTVSAMAYPMLPGHRRHDRGHGADRLLRAQVRRHVRAPARARRTARATDWLLWFSDIARALGLVIAAALASRSSVFALLSACKPPEGRRLADLIKLKVPLAGHDFSEPSPWPASAACSERCCTTACRFSSPWRSAATRPATACCRKRSPRRPRTSPSGQSLAGPLAASGHFPKTVVEMIAVAEESNTLDTVLVDIADGLEQRTSRQLDLIVRLLEPIMLLILAGVVLFVVIALLVPVIKMSSAMG